MPSNMSLPAHRLSIEDSSRGFNKHRGNGRNSRNIALMGVGAVCVVSVCMLWYFYSARSDLFMLGAAAFSPADSRGEQQPVHLPPHGSTGRGVSAGQKANSDADGKVLTASNTRGFAEAIAGAAAALVVTTYPEPLRTRNILLYTAETRINTGVWPNWGGDPPHEATLNWAAAGTVVSKTCPLPCAFIHDDTKMATADVVIVEGVNWPKFGYAGKPLPLPPRDRPNPRGGGGSLPCRSSGTSDMNPPPIIQSTRSQMPILRRYSLSQ